MDKVIIAIAIIFFLLDAFARWIPQDNENRIMRSVAIIVLILFAIYFKI